MYFPLNKRYLHIFVELIFWVIKMNEKQVNEKYFLQDMLYSDAYQTIYTAKGIASDSIITYILNHYTDRELINKIAKGLLDENIKKISGYVESFYIDFDFYVVFEYKLNKSLSPAFNRRKV